MKPPDIRISFQARDADITIRTITPEDERIEADFVRNLSPESRYLRFHHGLRELTPELLARFTRIDYPSAMALIATVRAADVERQIGVARYAATPPGGDTAEVAIVVADDWQGCGVGTRLLLELRAVARAAGYRHLHMRVLPQNRRMIALARRLGYEPKPSDEEPGASMLGKTLIDGERPES
ncbi:MAG: N-acetyltransferase family protein [Pseudomonadales bacterium]